MTGAGRHEQRSSRRRFLGGLLTGTIGLPWLESLRIPVASGKTPASTPRFVVMFSPNGTVMPNWTPVGTETEFTLSPILSPLGAHREDLIIVKGVDQQGAGGDGHQNGIGGMLTGAPLLPGRFAGQSSTPAGWADGPSVDQRIANTIGTDTAFRSLELGVQTGAADNWGRMCYRERNQPLTPREDPARTFDDIFAASLLTPEQREVRRERQTSILDYVRTEIEDLSVEVSAADRVRLEVHLTHLREIERRLDEQSRSLASCSLPPRPGEASADNDDFPAIGEAQLDLLALALACNQTRVASLQWSRSVSQVRFTWLDIRDGHHGLSHLPDSDADALDKLTRINAWYAERFAGLIERLKAYDEGEGTLFDHSLLLWCNELGKGNTHSRENAPYVLAGSAGGALSTGRFLEYEGNVPHNDLLVSLLNVMGIAETTFGNPDWCTGPLTGLV